LTYMIGLLEQESNGKKIIINTDLFPSSHSLKR